MLEIKNLQVKYKGSREWALKSIDISIAKGELIVIAGPSGSGKSTLAKAIIRVIPLFEEADIDGNIVIDGRDIGEMDRKTALMTTGYLPQYPADFVTSMLVEEEIAFPMENLGLDKQEIIARIKAVLQQLGIEHLRYRLVTELSSGELQKVALASMMAISPALMILDEPMARIDSKSEISLIKGMIQLNRNGTTIVAFEHRLDYLLPVADRVIVLDAGKIIMKGKPEEVIDYLDNIDLPEIAKIDVFQKRCIDLDSAAKQVIEYLDTRKQG
ncbi:MAG: energy-coupling factor ABC transporter ATP-binding protein [Candidatus Hodarchaeales archaeon]